MVLLLRRGALMATAAFAITGCSSGAGTGSSPVATLQQPAASSRAAQPGGLFVHRGVPYLRAQLSRSRAHTQGSYPTKRALLFVSNQSSFAVGAYSIKKIKSNPAPIASLPASSGCPYQSAMDKKGTLYVPNNCGGNSLDEFSKGSTSPSLTITDGISNPLGTAIDGSGNLYVSNYPPAISVYASGGTSPTETITGGGMIDPFGLAVDKHGNLFIADFGADQVFEVASGTTTLVPLNLQDMSEPLQLAFDSAGNMWVTDGQGDRVQIYAPGSTSPSRTISGLFSFPYGVSVNAAGVAFVSDVSQGKVYAFKKGASSPYATLTNGIDTPTGVLARKP
jgi:streptogramin lyase